VFVTDQIKLEAGLPAALSRLERLAGGGLVRRASDDAYREGLMELLRAGPVGYLTGSWRLAGVRLGPTAVGEGRARLALRWEITGAAGDLFPVLDADIVLTAAGDAATVLTLTGVYRLPDDLPAAGTGAPDMRWCAAQMVHSLLTRLACAINHPSGQAGPGSLVG
jgi:hypothetical protein